LDSQDEWLRYVLISGGKNGASARFHRQTCYRTFYRRITRRNAQKCSILVRYFILPRRGFFRRLASRCGRFGRPFCNGSGDAIENGFYPALWSAMGAIARHGGFGSTNLHLRALEPVGVHRDVARSGEWSAPRADEDPRPGGHRPSPIASAIRGKPWSYDDRVPPVVARVSSTARGGMALFILQLSNGARPEGSACFNSKLSHLVN
jgi:hypothetical protein